MKVIKKFVKRNMKQLIAWTAIAVAWFGGAVIIIHLIWQRAIEEDAMKIAAEQSGYLAGDDLIRASFIIAMVVAVAVALFCAFVEEVQKRG